MRFGLSMTVQQHLDTDMVSALEENCVMVRHARDQGWDSVFCGQHYLNTGDNQKLQQVPMLARLQAEAGEMGVGLGVMLINLHNPVYVAETVASLDVIWRGNLVFGVGLGYREVEFDAFGVPKGQRLRRFLEVLEVTRRLWSEERVSFESDWCRLEDVHMNIRPVQRPHPPIWVAANNDRMVQRAARIGDTWYINPHSTTATIRRHLALYREALRAAGRPDPAVLPCGKEIFCARDRPTALEQAGPYLAGKYRDYARWGQDRVMPGGEDFNRPFEELLRDRFILGSPEECVEQLRPYVEELGINHFNFRTRWAGMPLATALASMRLISGEVIPALRAMAPR